LFTLPGVVLIIVSGVLLAMTLHLPILHTPWIAGALGLFIVSGVLFVSRVTPLQKQMRAVAAAGLESAFDHGRYEALARQWELWGAAALITPLAALVLMVLKPGS